MLNKYPVIAHHFILATKAFKAQTDLLEDGDLAITYACLTAWGGSEDGGAGAATRRLFAFFNSGARSGASQSHRHVQFLPVEESGTAGGWGLLADRLVAGPRVDRGECVCSKWYGGGYYGRQLCSVLRSSYAACVKTGLMRVTMPDGFSLHSLPQLPFAHFAVAIPPDPSPEQLYDRYRVLYETAVEACRAYVETHPDEHVLVVEGDRGDHSAVIGYNLAMTTSTMVICPRRSEGGVLNAGKLQGSSKSVGPVAINGTILAGTLMVRTEEEWCEFRRDESHLYDLLRAVGIPIEHGPSKSSGRL